MRKLYKEDNIWIVEDDKWWCRFANKTLWSALYHYIFGYYIENYNWFYDKRD